MGGDPPKTLAVTTPPTFPRSGGGYPASCTPTDLPIYPTRSSVVKWKRVGGDPPKTLAWATDPRRDTPSLGSGFPAMYLSCFVHTDRPTHLSYQLWKWVGGDPPNTPARATDPLPLPVSSLCCFVHTGRPTHLSYQTHTRAQLNGSGWGVLDNGSQIPDVTPLRSGRDSPIACQGPVMEVGGG